MTDAIPDLHVTGAGSGGQFFPRYTFEQNTGEESLFNNGDSGELTRIDNISNDILADYRSTYGNAVTKDSIFYYVYALLHSPDYRAQFASDLKRVLARIPKVATVQEFDDYAEAGLELARLHLNYESIDPYPLDEIITAALGATEKDLYRVQKMTFGKSGKTLDRSTIIYNSSIRLERIPIQAHEYMLGSRSAIEWIMERYQVRTDKASGIINDPNDWSAEVGEPRYILELLKRITTVSVKTMEIIEGLPALRLADSNR
jgi:predicted helicase